MKIKFFEECRTANLSALECPPILFIIMGFATIVAMISSYLLASRYIEEPEVAAMVVIVIAVIFLIIGQAVVAGFTKIAEANRMKSEFISIISHQLRSPLSISKWTIDVLSADSRNSLSDEQTSNFIATLKDTNDRMAQMVNLLIEVGRIESGGFILKKEPVAIEKLTKSVVDLFSKFAAASNVEIKLEADSDFPVFYGDPERLRMVIENLLDNAIRYTKKRGAVTVSIQKRGDEIYWSVSDEGVGIADEYKKFIFHKFFRAPSALRYQTRGSGLGLYIVKAIVEESGGKVGFESVDGKGSKFWFLLPLK